MATRRKPADVDALIADVDRRLGRFAADRANLSLRDKVLCLCAIQETNRDLAVSVLKEHGWNVRAARDRIRLYLLEYVGEVIDGAELDVVSGISDYPRRIRELRVEQGFQIASGSSPDPMYEGRLKTDQYMLVSKDPDANAARRWHIANRIRNDKKFGSREKVKQYFLENVGQVVTTEELAYVAKDAKEYARRVRELRTESGYSISTQFTGRPDLKMGQYVLESAERVAEPHDRNIPDPIQRAVYLRDDNTCRICGWNRERWRPKDPRILELHHLEEHHRGGKNVERNLVVLCSRCHDEVHSGKHLDVLKRIAKRLDRS